jgi:predicted RNA-binding protein YlqC (UPF0109 family)
VSAAIGAVTPFTDEELSVLRGEHSEWAQPTPVRARLLATIAQRDNALDYEQRLRIELRAELRDRDAEIARLGRQLEATRTNLQRYYESHGKEVKRADLAESRVAQLEADYSAEVSCERAKLKHAEERIAHLEAALRDVEWGGTHIHEEGEEWPACPCCRELREDGKHLRGCELAAALKGTP